MAAFQDAIFYFLAEKKREKSNLQTTNDIYIWKEDEKASRGNIFLSAYLVA